MVTYGGVNDAEAVRSHRIRNVLNVNRVQRLGVGGPEKKKQGVLVCGCVYVRVCVWVCLRVCVWVCGCGCRCARVLAYAQECASVLNVNHIFTKKPVYMCVRARKQTEVQQQNTSQ